MLSIKDVESVIEAILFASGDVVSLKDIATALEQDEKTINTIIKNLADKYAFSKRGISIIQVGKGYQMCTNPDYYDYIKKLFQSPTRKKLSTTLLETLAIIAYKQPITKGAIEDIRGVSAEHSVNKLVEYGLVSEKGRLEAPGKPILFGTTDEFLRYFGFDSLEVMPTSDLDDNQLRLEAENEVNEITNNS